mgnify:CR=1 FL=1
MIPFLSLKDVTALHGVEINEAVTRVTNSGWYLQGKENESFEENYSKFIGTKYTLSENVYFGEVLEFTDVTRDVFTALFLLPIR